MNFPPQYQVVSFREHCVWIFDTLSPACMHIGHEIIHKFPWAVSSYGELFPPPVLLLLQVYRLGPMEGGGENIDKK